jgi:hypothetical protein
MAEALGSWILPQPVEKERYVAIPRNKGSINTPFGYRVDENDVDVLQPIPKELAALEEARKYVKKYTYREVAAWLTTQTGRSITATGLKKRFDDEITRKKRAGYYRSLARRYKEALQKAKEYEERLGTTEKTDFFDSDTYVQLSRDWEQEARDTRGAGRAGKRHLQAKSRPTDRFFGSA